MFTFLVMVCLGMNLYGAKADGVDENGRIYGKAYFDVITEGQPPVMDLIDYSKRLGSFDWTKYVKTAETLVAKKATIKIATRIEVPASITTPEVYVTTGKTYNVMWALAQNYQGDCSGEKIGGGAKIQWQHHYKYPCSNANNLKMNMYWNDTLQGSQDVLLVKPKTDAFGNRYIDYKIEMSIDNYSVLVDNGHMARSIKEDLDTINIKMAPKSRTFQSQWIDPQIYVLDE